MKTVKIIALAVSLLSGVSAFSQNKPDSLGLPGDNFDLSGALEVFKKAKNPEEFEKAINLKDNEINNLDLDGDGKTDYVKVIDKTEKNGHTLVMQVAVSETETQDVAVIEVEKTGNETAHVQIVGDEELYGKDYILEPADQVAANNAKTAAKENKGTEDDVYSTNDNSNRTTNTNNSSSNTNGNGNSNTNVVVNVWGWPSVQYIYGPSYVVWVSPWRWHYYPTWWNPWAPIYWRYHWRRAHFYHPYYHRAYFYRSPGVHSFYYGWRASSGTVHRNRESGFYRERQAEYRKNTPRGERYNNRPARDHRQQNGAASPRRENAPVRNTNPRSNQPANQNPRSTERQPNSEQRQNTRPNQQPRQNVQPRQQQPRIQSSPAPRQGGGGGSRGGGGSHGGGGRHR